MLVGWIPLLLVIIPSRSLPRSAWRRHAENPAQLLPPLWKFLSISLHPCRMNYCLKTFLCRIQFSYFPFLFPCLFLCLPLRHGVRPGLLMRQPVTASIARMHHTVLSSPQRGFPFWLTSSLGEKPFCFPSSPQIRSKTHLIIPKSGYITRIIKCDFGVLGKLMILY